MSAEFDAGFELLTMLLRDPRTGLLIGLLAVAAWCDWRTHKIPNGLLFGGALLGLVVSSLMPATRDTGLLGSLAGLATGLALLLPLYLMRVLGAADVKLMAMIGAFLGVPATVYAVLATLLAGGLLALVHAACRGVLRSMLRNVGTLLQSAWVSLEFGQRPVLSLEPLAATPGQLPYGLAIAGGTISYLVLRQMGFL